MKEFFRRYVSIKIYLCSISAVIVLCSSAVIAQEIDECLECHQDRTLTKTDATGKTHSLYVDKARYLDSIHGKLDYTCMECHEKATLEHPADGVPDVDCGKCHEEALKKYAESAHGKLIKSGNAKAPRCYDCHTMHYNFYANDSRSSINPKNIPETCSTCHAELVEGPGLLESFIVTKLKGHGKVNLAGGFRTDRCLDCHAEITSHGTKPKEVALCAKCHTPGKGQVNLGPIHKSVVFTKAPLRVAVKIFYAFGLAMVAFAFMSLAGKKYLKPKEEVGENQEQ